MDQEKTPIPGAAYQVWADWVWIVDGRELAFTKRPSQSECEAVMVDACQRLGLEAVLID